MNDLVERQLLFSRLLGKLLTYADSTGIAVAMGETWRSEQQAAWDAAHGSGIAASLHCSRLATDLLCFRLFSGKWTWLQAGTEPEYKLLGLYWKSLHPDACWGGDFTTPDPGHFSLAYGGHK